MKIDNVLNYLNTASPEQIDTIHKTAGKKKQAVLLKREYLSAMQQMKDKHETELKQAEASLRALKDRQITEQQQKHEWYLMQAASRSLHWHEVMAEPKKQRKGMPRRWKVVTPLANDTRTFIYLKNANIYRKRMGGYLYNTQTKQTYFAKPNVTRLLPS